MHGGMSAEVGWTAGNVRRTGKCFVMSWATDLRFLTNRALRRGGQSVFTSELVIECGGAREQDIPVDFGG